MNLYQLRYFVALAQKEHYRLAAQELGITQPALTHAIQGLEQELGVPLFQREGRGVVLNRYGKKFLTDAQAALDRLDASARELRQVSLGQQPIELAYLRTLGVTLIPRLAREFLRTPEGQRADFHFSPGFTSTILEGLRQGRYDLGFCSRMDREETIEFLPVALQRLVLIVPEDHPLAVHTSIDLRLSVPYPQIAFTPDSGLRPVVDGLFAAMGETQNIRYEVLEDISIAGLVAQGFGIAVVPEMYILPLLPLKVIQIESPSWERYFYLALRKNQYRPPAAEAFIRFVKEKAAQGMLAI